MNNLAREKKKINLGGMSNGTKVRIIGLFVILVNQIAVSVFDFQLLPFTDQEIYEGISTALTALASIITFYKNNSITKAAQEGDQVTKQLKEGKQLLNIDGEPFVKASEASRIGTFDEFNSIEGFNKIEKR